jgi:alpha-L-fucosidase
MPLLNMNINAISLVLLLTTFQAVNTEAYAANQKAAVARTKQQIMADSQRDRFGIFIHWGTSSVLELGGGSWNRENSKGLPQENQTKAEAPSEITSGEYLKYKGKEGVPQIVYDNLFHVFNPTNFDAVAWVKLFKQAGAGYIVFTSKHHDGFCMFDTKTQDYNIMHSPFRRDICKELADACRAEGIRLFFYYSPVDWWNPGWISNRDTAYEDDFFLPQVKELLTNYGPIDGIWWDGCQITKKYAKKTRKLIKQTQPWILTNGRLGGGDPGDFDTPEQTLGEFNLKEPWESCVTMAGDAWFWNQPTPASACSSNARVATAICCWTLGRARTEALMTGPHPHFARWVAG